MFKDTSCLLIILANVCVNKLANAVCHCASTCAVAFGIHYMHMVAVTCTYNYIKQFNINNDNYI